MTARPWAEDVKTLVAGIEAGATIGVSGFHFTRAPIAQLRALPAAATELHYLAWGGGLPLEVLLADGRVDRATLCFSSLDALGPAPRFRKAVETGELTLDEWTALGMITGLRAAGENLPFGTFQEPTGSSLTDSFSTAVRNPFGGEMPVRAVPPLSFDHLLLHAQRADEDGNVEIQGARGLDLSMIFAARQVLVTVEERVPRGSLGAPRAHILPRTFVSGIAHVPGGAFPTSCLPYYPTDYRALRRFVEAGADAVPASALETDPTRMGQLERWAGRPATTLVERIRRDPVESPDGYTTDELMVCVLASTIGPGAVCSVGSASPLPTAAYLLAKHQRVPNLLLMSHNGGLVDPPVRPLSLSAGELLDHELAVAHTGGDETYHWYYQRGLVTHEVVGSAQVDGQAATNNLSVRRRDGSPVRLPGQGGMADVANLHANFIIYLPRQGIRNTPSHLEMISAARVWHDPDQRRRFGLRAGRTMVVTDLAVFEFDLAAGALLLTSLHPGVELEQVREQTGFGLILAPDLITTPEPTSEQLIALRTLIDPLGIRRLDMVSATERQHLIDTILDHEERILDSWETT